MRIALITADNREDSRRYDESEPRFGTAPTALLEGFMTIPEAEIHVVCCVQRSVKSPQKLAENIYYHSLVVPKLGWMRGAYLGCISAVREKLKAIQPQIVHGQGTERHCALAATWSGFTNLITIHGNMREISRLLQSHPFSYLWLAAKLERITIPRAGGVICITNYTRRAVARLAKRTWVLPNAVDPRFFDIDADPNRNEVPIILCVGDIGVRKNQNRFIQSLDSIAARLKFRVVFLGRLDDTQVYGREFLELLQSRPWCRYEGFIDREKLKLLFQGASVLALPSLEDNCPMVVLEAMAAGLPVLASNVGGVPDLIQSGKTGLLCDPSDPLTISGGVKRLLENPEFCKTVAIEGRRHARADFHPSVIANRHIQIYEEVLSTRS
jgi:glycosyltransferase involved in cell wall biosynthesis